MLAIAPITAAVPSLSELLCLYVEGRHRRGELAPLTVETLRSNFSTFLRIVGDRPVEEFTRDDVERWLAEVELAPATVRTRLSQLRGFCTWALEHGHLVADPMLGIRRPRQPRLVPRGLELGESRALVRACPDSRARLVVLLMLQEGLRRKEVAGLEVGDVNFGERSVRIRGKGGHERVLPLSPETFRALTAYLREWPAFAGPLIRRYSDGRTGVTPATVGRLVSDLMRVAGVKHAAYDGRSAHSARHTAASDMLKHGAHLRDIQRALGHQSITSTERYLPLLVNGLGKAMGGRRYGS